MSSLQVDVDVFSQGRKVDGPLPRPLRKLPTGRAGVVYGGEVYPLYRGNRIDLQDETFDKYSCMSFVEPGETIPYASPPVAQESLIPGGPAILRDGSWNLETNRFGHYLVFDADEGTAARLVERLERSSLGVRRWDASHRPADDGRLYDWFVRLAFTGDRDECLTVVRSVLGTDQIPSSPAPQVAGLPEALRDTVLSALRKALVAAEENSALHREVEHLQGDLSKTRLETERLRAELVDDIAVARAEALAMQDRLDALQTTQEERRREMRERMERLQAAHAQQLAALRAELSTPTPAASEQTAEIEALEGQLAVSRREIDDLSNALDQAWSVEEDLNRRLAERDHHEAALSSELASVKAALERKGARLAEIDSETAERAMVRREKVSGRRRPDLDTFLDKLFQRCALDEVAIEELFKFTRIDKALHELMRIDRDDPQLRSSRKKVQGYDGWWEIAKINTGAKGDASRGRIYFKPDATGVKAMVHLKQDDDEQRRFLAKNLAD